MKKYIENLCKQYQVAEYKLLPILEYDVYDNIEDVRQKNYKFINE